MSTIEPAPTGIAAVRGAVTVPANTADAIREATARLLLALLEANHLTPERILSAVFTATPDLDADFPAHAARRLGWTEVPLLGAREMEVPGALPRVVRVLLTVTGVDSGKRLVPVYLDGAARLRPDLAPAMGTPTAPTADAAGVARLAAPSASDVVTAAAGARAVAIVGLGQIGGSVGLALGRAGRWRRTGFDADPAVASRALAAGAVDAIADSIAEACAGAKLAVVATPHDVLAATIDRVAAALPAGAALVDTGSARAGVTTALERAAARGIRAVGGHPIAGSEGHGFDAARADCFEGASFALLPLGSVPEIVIDCVRDLGAKPVEVAPGDHDLALARVSHLPYVIACALATCGGPHAERGLAGPGFRDMTRLSRSDPRVALAYCRANAHEIAAGWRELRDDVDRRITELERGT